MLLKIYKNQILKPVVKFWLLKSWDFILKEDGNSRYKKTHNQKIFLIVEKSKKQSQICF